MSVFSLGEFVVRLGLMEADLKLAEEAIVEKAAQLIEERAKDAIGTYEFGWPQLAESTQEDRSRQGFTPNDPLKRTGHLKASIGHVSGREEGVAVAYVGTNDPKALSRWRAECVTNLLVGRLKPRRRLRATSSSPPP